MKRIAVIGLGIMGHGIADNFLKNGFKITVWNRTPSKAADLVSRGAKLAQSPKEASAESDIVFEVTANDESSEQVWLGDDGILKAPTAGKTLITCATLSVDWVLRLDKACKKNNALFFDMPMTGGRTGAESGQLVLLVGGDEGDLDNLRIELKAIAKDVKYFGQIGSGTKYKLILNTLQAIHMVGFGETMKMAKAVRLDERKTADALAERPGGVVTKVAADSYFSKESVVTFSADWITKDLKYTEKMIKNLDHQLLSDVLTQFEKVIKQGYGSEDWTKVLKL